MFRWKTAIPMITLLVGGSFALSLITQDKYDKQKFRKQFGDTKNPELLKASKEPTKAFDLDSEYKVSDLVGIMIEENGGTRKMD
jgi:hypothetical protein